MKKLHLLLLILGITFSVNAQNFYKPSSTEIKKLPDWAREMYSENPNVYLTDSLYREYYSTHTFEKNYSTQYYKRWRRNAEHSLDEKGFIQKVNPSSVNPVSSVNVNRIGNAPWQLIGPFVMYDGGGNKTAEQTNVYSIHQNENNPNVMYCGTEPGDIFKSTDAGAS